MRRAAAALLILAATAVLAAVPSADARSWATGVYRGANGPGFGGDDLGPKNRRGKVVLAVTRRAVRVKRLTMVLRCESGTHRFTVRGAGSVRLKEGPMGAGFRRPLRGRRVVDGYALDWDLMGGIRGGRFRSTIDAFAERDGDRCGLQGQVLARRR